MHAHVQRAVAVQAALVRELEVLDVPRRHGATSTQAWLRARFRISPGAAKRLETLAQTTGDRTPAVTEALEAGTVNADQAAAIAKVLANVPSGVRAQAEEHLVAEAKTFGPDDLGRLGERVLEHVARRNCWSSRPKARWSGPSGSPTRNGNCTSPTSPARARCGCMACWTGKAPPTCAPRWIR
jgi:hypothetical protein